MTPYFATCMPGWPKLMGLSESHFYTEYHSLFAQDITIYKKFHPYQLRGYRSADAREATDIAALRVDKAPNLIIACNDNTVWSCGYVLEKSVPSWCSRSGGEGGEIVTSRG